jgi:hypothetical protein
VEIFNYIDNNVVNHLAPKALASGAMTNGRFALGNSTD